MWTYPGNKGAVIWIPKLLPHKCSLSPTHEDEEELTTIVTINLICINTSSSSNVPVLWTVLLSLNPLPIQMSHIEHTTCASHIITVHDMVSVGVIIPTHVQYGRLALSFGEKVDPKHKRRIEYNCTFVIVRTIDNRVLHYLWFESSVLASVTVHIR